MADGALSCYVPEPGWIAGAPAVPVPPAGAVSAPRLSGPDVTRVVDGLLAAGHGTPTPSPPLEVVLRALDAAARRLGDGGSPLRARAEEGLPRTTGLSLASVREGLDLVAAALRRPGLEALLRADVGDPDALDGLVTGPSGTLRRARGPRLLVEVLPGNVFPASAQAVARAVLLRSPVLLKLSSEEPLLAPLLLAEVAAHAAAATRSVAALWWPGGEAEVEAAAFARAEVVAIHGEEATLRDVAARLPAGARLVPHGPRLSIAVCARESLRTPAGPGLARALARDVALYDQRGCLSAAAVLAEEGGEISPRDLARRLAEALAEAETRWPRGSVLPETASAIHQARGALRARPGAQVHESRGGTLWTAAYDPGPDPVPTPRGRFVSVRPFTGGEAGLARALDPFRGALQGAALAASPPRDRTLAGLLASAGASRVCTPGGLQSPPLSWRQDGRPPLGDLLSWTSWEPPTTGG